MATPRMKKNTLIALLLTVMSIGVRAYELQRAMDNMAEDVSACVAFYTITIALARQNAEKMNDQKWRAIATQYESTLTKALDMLRMTMTGKPKEFIDSKIDLRMNEQIRIGETEGIDRLVLLHADSCKALMENPDQRLKYWKDKQ